MMENPMIENLEIDFDFDEADEAERLGAGGGYRFNFPCVSITKNSRGAFVFWFNNAASKYICGAYIKAYLTPELVVFRFCTKKEGNAFTLTHTGGLHTFSSAWFSNKGVRSGTYRLYKVKDGLAIKKYEPM